MPVARKYRHLCGARVVEPGRGPVCVASKRIGMAISCSTLPGTVNLGADVCFVLVAHFSRRIVSDGGDDDDDMNDGRPSGMMRL